MEYVYNELPICSSDVGDGDDDDEDDDEDNESPIGYKKHLGTWDPMLLYYPSGSPIIPSGLSNPIPTKHSGTNNPSSPLLIQNKDNQGQLYLLVMSMLVIINVIQQP